MMIERPERLEGKKMGHICGMAEHSIIPGYVGIEAGQAAFGDIFAWYKSFLMWPIEQLLQNTNVITEEQKELLLKQGSEQMFFQLEREIKEKKLSLNHDLTAVDWFNGRRYPVLNEKVKGAITGLHLGVTVPSVYQTLINAAVFGSKRIFDSFLDHELRIDRIIVIGGIAKKSPYIMQMMSDVLGRPIMVSKEEQVCAKGAAIYAAVAAGLYKSIEEAQQVFSEPYVADFHPNLEKTKEYADKYMRYLKLAHHTEKFYE